MQIRKESSTKRANHKRLGKFNEIKRNASYRTILNKSKPVKIEKYLKKNFGHFHACKRLFKCCCINGREFVLFTEKHYKI